MIIIGLEQPVSSFCKVSVLALELLDIVRARQGIMIVRKRIESLKLDIRFESPFGFGQFPR